MLVEANPPLPVSEAERAAVRRALAARGWSEARPPRPELLPLLQAVQDEHGWLSRGALHELAERTGLPLPDVWGVATFYALLRLRAPDGVCVHVCDSVPCRLRGGEALLEALQARFGPPHRFHGEAHAPDDAPVTETGAADPMGNASGGVGPSNRSPSGSYADPATASPESGHAPAPAGGGTTAGDTSGGDAAAAGAGEAGPRIDWETVPCLGQCEKAPAALVAGRLVGWADVAGIVAAAAADRAPDQVARPSAVAQPAAPGEVRRVLARVGRVDPGSLTAYREAGGYRALPAAVALGPEGVLEAIEASGLLGRGGAAFAAAIKWRAVARAAGTRRIVCNADESEPGTFKDRVLMEEDPFALVEAMTIAALTVGAEEAWVYIRGEYGLAADRLAEAVRQCERAGLLGGEATGGRPLRIRVFRGAGAYVCGEETALFNSLEGRRGEPRSKPPYPTEAGLFGGPTLVNNVETLANIPIVLTDGAAGFRGRGTERSTGTKLYCVSGHVARPGLYETPFGATLGDLLAAAGGMRGGRPLRAALVGGAAGTFLGPDRLATALTFEGLRAVGASVGSGALVFIDDSVAIWPLLARIARFFQEESCGQCVPCRVGTQRQLEIVERLAGGARGPADGELLGDLAAVMADASICGLGQTAANAVLSALALDGDR